MAYRGVWMKCRINLQQFCFLQSFQFKYFVHMLRYSLLGFACILLAAACTTENKSNETQESYIPMDNIPKSQSTSSSAGSTYAKYAFDYLQQEKAKFNLKNPQTQLKFVSENIDKQNNKHVKFQQVLNNIPVWGREIIVHLDKNNEPYQVSGEVLTGIHKIDTSPALSGDHVNNMILQHDPWRAEGWKVNGSELCVFNQGADSYLTYRLTLVKGLYREFLFVNANDGTVIHKISGNPTAIRF